MTYKTKLIEVALPLAKINAESARENAIRHGHPATLHLWWARRPLAAARAVLWASLVDDPSSHPEKFPTEEDQNTERKRLFAILERILPWEVWRDESSLAEARIEIAKSCPDGLPKILDPFAGGGAIPLEALRLGLPTFASDLNPVAVLIERAMLEIPARFAGRASVSQVSRDSTLSIWTGTKGLSSDVGAYGRWMRDQAKHRIGRHYRDIALKDGRSATPIAWLWARTVRSPDPSWSGHVPLVSSWILSKRPGKPTTWVKPIIDFEAQTITYEIRSDGMPAEPTVSNGNGMCIATGAPIPTDYIKREGSAGRMSAALLAVVAETKGGRLYVQPTSEGPVVAYDDVPWSPAGAMSNHPQYMGTPRYGIDEWWQLFTPRQLLALTTFSDLLAETWKLIETDAIGSGMAADGKRLRDGGAGAAAYADAVVTYLSFVIDKCADYWSSACTWHNSRELIRNTFGGQAIPMTWDFAETNPFSSSTGNWMAMVDWVAEAISALPTCGEAEIQQRDARARIGEVGNCVISTDPPYYDNVYSDISDFFYAWLRRNLRGIWPDECAMPLTPKTAELVANQYRAGSADASRKHFESGIQEVLSCAALNADPGFPATIFSAFETTESTDDGVTSTGWETFLRGLLDAGYAITATWPLRTELGSRMRALGANALASSVVLACRPRELAAPMATRDEFIAELRSKMEPVVRLLQEENIAPIDMAQSAIGPGVTIFSRYAKVVEADGTAMAIRTALGLINDVLAEVLSGEESEFDAETRFALSWFEQFGHNPGPLADADLLARAKDTTVVGVAQAGLAVSRDGKVRLLERSELAAGWDPEADPRLTVWETTQQLMRAVESSETEAAALLVRLGGELGDRARQLAYLLYSICDRRRWPDDAAAYNMLVTAWPGIRRRAVTRPGCDEAEGRRTGPSGAR